MPVLPAPKSFQVNGGLAQDFFLHIGNSLRNIFLHQKKKKKGKENEQQNEFWGNFGQHKAVAHPVLYWVC